ncbi:GNAT family N-acetyltransferase [Cryobacterium sinapicolor]|uniref:GNAT family N-acetyltransferase n=1 Tax=Cryobacterium sinapicolor TaxID=1259236 RepID=A0ABY2J455_9MICO|nr:GNAT family N-acetyltransferase [Cryobacterium sinapicolor]TFC99635.1 GNAT family N-acetyltransferase [Cryobacterium sinapicolor]
MPTTITIESPRQPEITELLRLSGEYAQSLYPPESNFLLSVAELEQPGVAVYVARDATDRALGIAALVGGADTGDGSTSTAELKRMFVHPVHRGRGVAGRLLAGIETDAAARGIREIVLETGPESHAALSFYRGAGYREVPLFGQYLGEAFSVCFAKAIPGAVR